MSGLNFDTEQRFTCQQCGRCCRRGWDISLTPGEVTLYRKSKVARWYRENEEGPEGTETDPFEPIPGHAPYERIRKRTDGVCGFLSPQNRCRIHEEMGPDKKPLTCRLFPFRFHPSDKAYQLTASFCCPTVVANEGAALPSQARELDRLRREWITAFPERAAPLSFAPGRSMDAKTLRTLRQVLRQMLDRKGDGGQADLASNVKRMAKTLEDLSRHRVLRLAPEAFAEYLELTGRHAAKSQSPVGERPPSYVGRLLFRGFLYIVVATRLQLEDGRSSGLRVGLRLRLLRLLAHFHGLWPRAGDVDLGLLPRASLHLEDPPVHGLVYNYLRASIETLGTGRRPVLEEFAVSVAFLNAAFVIARLRAAQQGMAAADAGDLAQGLMEAVDLTHAWSGGAIGGFLSTLSGGVEALYLFAAGTSP
jgi:Fe-S-cluster containining protein